VVNVFSPVNVFTSANEVTPTPAETTSRLLTVDVGNSGAAAFYRYFSQFTWY
jgi:hypothetical protein